jgi:hypothetical protein
MSLMKHLLFRALGIWTLKTVVYAAFTLASILLLIESVPPAIMAAAYYFISFLLAFLFSEWVFLRGRMDVRRLIVIIVATFAWDTVLTLAFSAWLLGLYRYPAPWTQYLVFFAIHAGAMSFAYYARKRFAAVAGLAEGLEA